MTHGIDLPLLWTIQLAPLAAFLLIQILPRPLRKFSPLVAILLAFAAAAASCRLLWVHQDASGFPLVYSQEWLRVSDNPISASIALSNYSLSVGFLVDKLNLLMITLVTTITFFVQLFSFYYMAGDSSRARYFGFLSFFAFSMTGLVLSSNLLQTFLFWELVGLASYLLIGFWLEKPSAATAARKAFVLNRLADLGFYLGIILLFLFFGSVQFTDLDPSVLQQQFSGGFLTLLGILVFMGVMGKSAQFPFHVWLPDAMEGPTPVSALIHSATMVAAGVFLTARAFGLFASSEATLAFILAIGALTALAGAMLATVQRDIKKIMAYSTVSQLGLMVMAMGAGSSVPGMFHLTTHAYFKSLLFLTAGSFIHRFHTNDIWEIARDGGKKQLLPLAALVVGLFSLCGIFPFAGFFSKDLILEALHEASPFYYGIGVFVSFLTVYYSFRLLFILLFSAQKPHGHGKAHAESPLLKACEAVPLTALAVISFFAGLKGTAVFDFVLLRWLGGHETHLNPQILWTTVALIVFGAGAAFLQFRHPEAAEQKLENGRGWILQLLKRKFFLDDLYVFLVKQIGLRFAGLLDWFDRSFVNGVLVNQTSYFILRIGKLASGLQNGLLQDYLTWSVGAGIAILFWLLYAFRGPVS